MRQEMEDGRWKLGEGRVTFTSTPSLLNIQNLKPKSKSRQNTKPGVGLARYVCLSRMVLSRMGWDEIK